MFEHLDTVERGLIARIGAAPSAGGNGAAPTGDAAATLTGAAAR
jgi:hypothetical protein